MEIPLQEVEKVARLANIPLSPSERKKYSRQLSDVLDFVKRLDQLDVRSVAPAFQTTGLRNVFREDRVDSSRCLKKMAGKYFRARNVFGETHN